MKYLSFSPRLMLAAVLWSSAQTAPADTGKVSIEGVNGEMRKSIEAWLSLDDEPCEAPQKRLQGRLDQAADEVRHALQAFGYYAPEITHSFNTGNDNTCWSATITIEPGLQVRLRHIDIDLQGEGRDDDAFRALVDNPPLKSGAPLRHDRYDSFRNSISNLAAGRGYFEGRFSRHELRVDPAVGVADVFLHFDTGPRFRFGDIRIEQDSIDTDLVQRFLEFHSGEHFSRKPVTDTSRALSGSGYFASVLVEPVIDAAQDNRVPVRIVATPSNRHRYTASVGYTTDTGPRTGLGYRNQRINRDGHQFTSDLSLSTVISTLTLGYSIPMDKPLTDHLKFEAGYKYENTDSFRTATTAVSATWTHLRDNQWLEERALGFGREDYKIGNQDNAATYLLMPEIGWSRTIADDRLYPRRGLRMNFKTRGSLDQVVSDVSFLQLLGDAKGILGLPWRSRLIGRINAGVSVMDDIDNLPVSVRFFAGGDNSIRGYGYKSLGPKADDGSVEGGKNLLTGSLEVEHLFTAKWSVAAFVDSGNAFNGTDINPSTGVGVGIHWRSPVGPVRLDVAHPLDKKGDLVRIHFVMGPDL
jgi:translocation and assembly module TamA